MTYRARCMNEFGEHSIYWMVVDDGGVNRTAQLIESAWGMPKGGIALPRQFAEQLARDANAEEGAP